MRRDYDVVIVGNGLAAATLALSLSPQRRIALLCKNRLAHSASAHAQGGIAAVLDALDRVEDHVADTLVAGAGHSSEAVVRTLLARGAAAVTWLQNQGVAFSREADGGLHLTREGGHGARRIAHVADRTGAAVMQQLQRHLRAQVHIDIIESCLATEVLTDAQGRACGVRVWQRDRSAAYYAPQVALASGGLGQIYAHTTTPAECTGDGIAMAWRAGCRVTDLAFIQFHPTGLALPPVGGQTFLISEAVRGEGGVLRNQAGERFMPRYDQRAELAPRDIVARSIAAEIAAQTQPFVWLDISHLPAAQIRHHFPTIAAHCAARGIDITRAPIPVRPLQHYTCGGVLTDVAGRTDVPGLFCLGEVACTGLHGANRLASNSLLECVVMGRLAAEAIEREEAWPRLPENDRALTPLRFGAEVQAAAAAEAVAPFARAALQALCSRELGILRRRHGVHAACRRLDAWFAAYGSRAANSVAAWEARSLLTCARLVAHAAAAQNRSLGAHYWADES